MLAPATARLQLLLPAASGTPRAMHARPQQRAAALLQPAAAAARRRGCRAAAEPKEGGSSTQGTAAQPQVPGAPPAPAGAAGQQQQQQQAADTLAKAETLSVDEIQQRAAQIRAAQAQAKAGDAKEGLLEGVSEEVGLIKWPSPLKAVVQTLLVIAIVGGTSALLLAINGALSELSKLY